MEFGEKGRRKNCIREGRNKEKIEGERSVGKKRRRKRNGGREKEGEEWSFGRNGGGGGIG